MVPRTFSCKRHVPEVARACVAALAVRAEAKIESAKLFGGAVGDIFAGLSAGYATLGDEPEQQACSEAAALAEQNAKFTQISTPIQDKRTQLTGYRGRRGANSRMR
jgi:hypothetical protein